MKLGDLEGYEKQDAVKRIISTVDIIPEEEIVVQGRLAADFEELQEVEELTVHWAGRDKRMV